VDNVAKAILDDAAVQMNNDPHLRASIAGYTDGSKREARIKGLALKRAQAVVAYLVGKGIDASRLTATDGGASTIGNSKTEAGRKENRRAEILLSVH
jgi:outer membrane protein OmpA-like peptidoglycan-associated protein